MRKAMSPGSTPATGGHAASCSRKSAASAAPTPPTKLELKVGSSLPEARWRVHRTHNEKPDRLWKVTCGAPAPTHLYDSETRTLVELPTPPWVSRLASSSRLGLPSPVCLVRPQL